MGDWGPGWAVGNSSLIRDVDDEETETLVLVLVLDGPADPALSPGASLSGPGAVWILEHSTSPPVALWALLIASGRVCSSGDELDCFRGVGEKVRSGSWGPGLSAGWSIGIPPSLTSSSVDLSS